MEKNKKEKNNFKTLALVLVILTVLISATSTWMLITNSMNSEPDSSFNKALVQLRIIKGQTVELPQTDSNAGDVKLYIAESKGG